MTHYSNIPYHWGALKPIDAGASAKELGRKEDLEGDLPVGELTIKARPGLAA